MDDPALTALVLEVAKREWGEDEETREHSLRQLRDWVLKNPNIRGCRTDDIFLLGFLRAKKFSVQNAQQMLLLFMERRQNVAKLTSNLDILEPKINIIVSCGCLYMSPFQDEQGRSISISYPNAIDLSEHCYIDHARSVFVNAFNMMNNPASQVLGVVHVFDLANYGAAHAAFWPPLEMIETMKLFEQLVPIRHKEIHIVNLNSVVKAFFNMIRFALSKKIQNRLHIHDTLEDLHKKVSQKFLPKEYGGEMPAKEMIELWKKKMIESRELVLSISEMRLVQDNAAPVIETGSFRKLVID